MTLPIHIVSFDIPYPPNYGGVIDVYHKIRALREAGAEVILHCFTSGRDPAPELEPLCREIHYYPRHTDCSRLLRLTPYIVSSRQSETLLNRLREDAYPILFEGLHTCGLLREPSLQDRVKIYRESNIEHHYYYHLFRASNRVRDRLFFLTESLKLKRFQRVLDHADLLLAVSLDDLGYLQQRFPGKQIRYLPSFHRNDSVRAQPGVGRFVLYHGNLSVAENIRAVNFIVNKIYTDDLPELIVAGLNPPPALAYQISRRPNIRLEPDPDDRRMGDLIREAQVNLMVTSQPTGLKLKLLHALFEGRHCLVNPEMLAGTGLHPLCHSAHTPEEFRKGIRHLYVTPFTPAEIARREQLLEVNYSNKKNCKSLIDLVTLLCV